MICLAGGTRLEARLYDGKGEPLSLSPLIDLVSGITVDARVDVCFCAFDGSFHQELSSGPAVPRRSYHFCSNQPGNSGSECRSGVPVCVSQIWHPGASWSLKPHPDF